MFETTVEPPTQEPWRMKKSSEVFSCIPPSLKRRGIIESSSVLIAFVRTYGPRSTTRVERPRRAAS
jgi:hypothetical protein